jgi:hypothetical protein
MEQIKENGNSQELAVGGYFTYELVRDGKVIDTWKEKNIVVNQGLNYILDAALSGGTVNTVHYIGLFSNNYTPIAGTLIANLTEVNAKYNETTRPTWTEAGAASQTISNGVSPASFTFNASETIHGAFLISNNTKGGTTGTLIAASKFAASRNVVTSDVLNVTYTISASST